MYQIIIAGETPAELMAQVRDLVEMYDQIAPAPKSPAAGVAGKSSATSRRAASKPAAPAAEPEAVDDTDRELLEDVPPAPETANQVVDAGTGKAATPTVQMTFNDVKLAAARLVKQDQAELAKILKKYGAETLSGVPKDKLGDFAADVMEALG